MGEDEADQQRLLLARRGACRPGCPWGRGGPARSEACGPTSVRPAARSRARPRAGRRGSGPPRRRPAGARRGRRARPRARGWRTETARHRRGSRRIRRVEALRRSRRRAAATAMRELGHLALDARRARARRRGCSSSRRLRERSARSRALTRAPCSASTASTSRSRKRRRSPAGPRNSPSRSGVSQTSRRYSAKAEGEDDGRAVDPAEARGAGLVARRVEAGAEAMLAIGACRASIEMANAPGAADCAPCRRARPGAGRGRA